MFVGENERSMKPWKVVSGILKCETCHKDIGNDEPQTNGDTTGFREVGSDGDICGGVVESFLEPVLEKHAEVYQRIDHLEKTVKGIFITVSMENTRKTP